MRQCEDAVEQRQHPWWALGFRVVLIIVAVSATTARPASVTAAAQPLLSFSAPDGSLAIAAEDGTARRRIAGGDGGAITSHSWAPNGGRLAFTRCSGRNCNRPAVFVVRPDGTGQRLVLAGGDGAVWAEDGAHLIASGPAPGETSIVDVAAGTRRRFVAPGLASAPYSPRLSPDGRWLLHLTAIYGRPVPNRYAPHHARARNWLILTELGTGRSRRVSGERGFYLLGTAAWSADSERFTFVRRDSLQATRGALYVGAPQSTQLEVLVTYAREGAALAPDGTRVAFNVGLSCAIDVASIDGVSPVQTLPFRGCGPTWR
jgi:hypothetical protein